MNRAVHPIVLVDVTLAWGGDTIDPGDLHEAPFTAAELQAALDARLVPPDPAIAIVTASADDVHRRIVSSINQEPYGTTPYVSLSGSIGLARTGS